MEFKTIISQKSNAAESNHSDESDIGGIYITFSEKHFLAKVYRRCKNRSKLPYLCIGQIEASTCPPPPGHTPGIWHLCRPGEEGIWLSESSRGWGIWSPCFRGGEFELHLRFHVKSLAWRAIMGDAVLEDCRGKDCAFVANWLQGKGLNKLCAVFEVFKF